MKIWVLAAAAMLPGAAQAADVTFTVNDVRLTAPIPAGYCLPQGQDRVAADLLAKGDQDNVTLATLIRCDMAGRAEGAGNDYMLIKTPKLALDSRVTRGEFLTAMGAEFGKAEWSASGSKNQETKQRAMKGVSDAFETPIDITGDIAPRGTDADCAYIGGSLNVTGGGLNYPIIAGGCITVAGGKIVAVYSYDDPGKGGGAAGKMRTARNVALTIRSAN